MAVAAIVTVLDDVALWLKAKGWGCGCGVVICVEGLPLGAMTAARLVIARCDNLTTLRWG